MRGSSVVIVAGGTGSRFGSQIPKQYLLINDQPVLVYTIRRFAGTGLFQHICVVVHPDYHQAVANWMKNAGIDVRIVSSGPERQDSVANGLEIMIPESEKILVHDAARPLVSRETIAQCLSVLDKTPAVVAGYRARDTIKRIDKEGKVMETLDRQSVFIAQTPQGFTHDAAQIVLNSIRSGGFLGTDDVFFAEKAGLVVETVESSPLNMKITTPADLEMVKALMANGTID